MPDPAAIFGTDLTQIPILISAVGALGIAAMGIVEALGKGLFVFDIPWARKKQIPVGLWAGVAAVSLSLLYHWATAPKSDMTGWMVALLAGLAAVPLAPIAKDLSSSVSQALSALGQINGKAGV